MAEMTRRDQELQGLYELRQNKEALERREKERKEIEKKLDGVEGDIGCEAGASFHWLNVYNASNYSTELDKKIEKARQRKQDGLCGFLGVAIALLGALMMILIKLNGGVEILELIAKTDIFSTLYFVSVFTIVLSLIGCFFRTTQDRGNRADGICAAIMFVLILVALTIAVHVTTFSGRMPNLWTIFLSILLGALAGLTVLPLIILLLGTIIASFGAMIAIQNYLVAMPVLMIVLALASMFIRVKKREYTKNEKRLLNEKRALDAKNQQINEQKLAEATRKVREMRKGRLNELNSQLSRCKSEIATLKTKIKNNGWLFDDDIQWMDKVIYYIQSRRADSIKEALRLVDLELEQERRRKLDEQRHKEIMEEIEYQSWEMANMRAEQREAAERAEKALRDSEAAAERARYEDEMRRYEEEWKAEQHRQNVEWELRNRR